MSDDDQAPPPGHVEVPIGSLSAEALQRIVDDLVTRDGTDYGAVEKTREQKAAALLRLLERGEARLVFDPATESISVLTQQELARLPPSED
jgi:uncharacterized protein YheU (UPF0270 family)